MSQPLTCPACHEPITLLDAAVCPRCGAPLLDEGIQRGPTTQLGSRPHASSFEPEIAPCPRCGQPVASLCLFCPHCDEPLEPGQRRGKDSGPSFWVGNHDFLAIIGFLALVLFFVVAITGAIVGSWLWLIGYAAMVAALIGGGCAMNQQAQRRNAKDRVWGGVTGWTLVLAGLVAGGGFAVLLAGFVYLFVVCATGK